MSILTNLFINISNIISPHCYSILKVESYTDCQFKCMYCYGRWYRKNLELNPNYQVLRSLDKTLRLIRDKNMMLMPIRLSTLTEPFQPIEEKFKVSCKILRISYKYRYPIIINSKGLLIIEEPWISEINKLNDENLIVYQLSISTFNNKYLKILEPNAPNTLDRLRVAAKLIDMGIPVIIRLSPFIPEIVYEEIDKLIDTIANIGVKQVIIEGLRLTKNEFLQLYDKLGFKQPKLEAYSIFNDGLLRHDLLVRLNLYREIRRRLDKENIKLSFCKEGIYDIQSAQDCCGIYLLAEGAKRITLYEIYNYIRNYGEISIEEIDKVFRYYYQKGYLNPEDLRILPRYLRKPIINHQRKLLYVLKHSEILAKVAPALKMDSGKVRLVKIRCC